MWNFKVKGMSCGHCKKAVTSAIQDLDKNSHVEIDIASGWVRVVSEHSQSDLTTAIEEAGYEVESSNTAK